LLEYQHKIIIKNLIIIDSKNLKINIIRNNQIQTKSVIITDNLLIKIINQKHTKINAYKHVAQSCEINSFNTKIFSIFYL